HEPERGRHTFLASRTLATIVYLTIPTLAEAWVFTESQSNHGQDFIRSTWQTQSESENGKVEDRRGQVGYADATGRRTPQESSATRQGRASSSFVDQSRPKARRTRRSSQGSTWIRPQLSDSSRPRDFCDASQLAYG